MAVGNNQEILKQKGTTTQVRDLKGKTLAPGFIDSHGHFAQYLPLIESPFLYPAPMGKVNSFDDIKQIMTNYFNQPNLDTNSLHVAFGYDDAELKEKQHPTKQFFDTFSKEYLSVPYIYQDTLRVVTAKGLILLDSLNKARTLMVAYCA